MDFALAAWQASRIARHCAPSSSRVAADELPRRLAAGGGDRWLADRRSASDARNTAGWSAPCRRRRRIPNWRDRRSASGRWPRSAPAATAAGSSAPHCRRRSDPAPVSTSKAWASAVLPRETGRETRIMCWAGRALRWRGAAEEGLLARPERPSRWTLPITALRVTFPSSAAIWLAESPPSQSFFNCSTRSSVQVNTVIALFPSCRAGHSRSGVAIPNSVKNPCRQNPLALAERGKRARAFTPNTGNG